MDDVARLRRGTRLLSTAVSAFAEATADLDRLLALVASSLGEGLDCVCSVRLLEGDGSLHEVASWTPDTAHQDTLRRMTATSIRPGDPSTAWAVMASGTTLHVPHLDFEDIGRRTSPAGAELLRSIDARSLVVAPLRVQATSLGVLSLLACGDRRPAFDALDVELARDLASHAALAISNARLLDALRDTQDLVRAQQETVRANRFLDALIEHLPSMVFVKDADNLAFTRFNRAGEQLLGITRAELIGKTDLDLFPPAEAAFFQAKDRETLARGELVDIPEESIHTRSGERWLHTKKVPILDELGRPTHLLGISYDLTDRKRAAEELRAAKDQAEAASKELEAFSYSVAHDLRAPLRAIDGFSQALVEDHAAALGSDGQRYLQRIRESAQRMAMLIDDLLALSRVTRAEIHRERVDLTALAHTCVARLQRAEPARVVEIAIAEGLTAHGDPRLLAIVLDNLFDNAWKFTSKTADARIALAPAPGGFVIRDNGAGFDMAYAGKLFGVFQRLHGEREFPGTGIGLATVARIVRRHQGSISAEGAPGAGAAFHVSLPAQEEP